MRTKDEWRAWQWRSLAQHLFGGLDVEVEQDTLDRAVEMDMNLSELHDSGKLPELTCMLDEWLTACPDDASAAQSLEYLLSGVYADGPSPRAFLVAVRGRVEEVRADPSRLPRGPFSNDTGIDVPRAGRWSQPQQVSAIVSAALVPHESAIDTWLAAPPEAAWQRQHYYTDLSTTLGVVGQVTPVQYQEYGPSDILWDQAIDVVCTVVTVRREMVAGHFTGQPDVMLARPELTLDSVVRAEFPDLCHFYGGYFGQDFTDERTYPVREMANAMNFTGHGARIRLATQLAELLRHSDEDMQYVLFNCGSYVVPPGVRHWVERTLWRLETFDWGKPRLEPPAGWYLPVEQWAAGR